jgi:hypothetical protein
VKILKSDLHYYHLLTVMTLFCALAEITAQEVNIPLAQEKMKWDIKMETNLRKYISTAFLSSISDVFADDSTITIRGESKSAGAAFLCEVTPSEDVTENISIAFGHPLKPGTFIYNAKRFVPREGFNYDRLLSKWVIAEKTRAGYRLLSHAHYPDSIKAKNDLPKELPAGRKGLGGYTAGRGHQEDLDELGVTSVTVNILLARLFSQKDAAGSIKHIYNGKEYYFRGKEVGDLDSTLLATARKGLITAAILLIDKAGPGNETGRLLQHPDMDPSGIYSMPNMTNPSAVNCYAAVLDFLAGRYSRPDKKYGRIHHYIMHNEVDAGWVWTNMGEKSALIFMDTYIKSMRLCYAIARQYNPHSQVFISLTHDWTWTSEPHFYPSKDLLEILIRYTKAEGDFQWALAHHPYPQSLYEPKTWLDGQVDYTLNTPLITFKNLEVLNAWIMLPEVLYRGKVKRMLWLSENGTNSKSYSDQDLIEQAAGFAYTWKKMEKLSNIDGFQWHNWFDHRAEGGLRIGLRRFPDDPENPGKAKPVWYVYRAAGTKNENIIFDQYMEIIGIKSWDEVIYKGEIR